MKTLAKTPRNESPPSQSPWKLIDTNCVYCVILIKLRTKGELQHSGKTFVEMTAQKDAETIAIGLLNAHSSDGSVFHELDQEVFGIVFVERTPLLFVLPRV